MKVAGRTLATIPEGHILREAAFAVDGSAVGFLTTFEGRSWVVGADGRRADYDAAGGLVVGPSGVPTAHIARRRGRVERPTFRHGWTTEGAVPGLETVVSEEDLWLVAVDARIDRELDWVGSPVFRADGGSVAYWALDRGRGGNAVGREAYFVVLDGDLIGPFESPGWLEYHPLGRGLVFSSHRDGAVCLTIDGRPGPDFDFVFGPSFHPVDGSVWYWGRRGEVHELMRDHEPVHRSEAVPAIPGPSFDRRDGSVGYWAREGGRWHAVRDGVVVGTAEGIVEMVPEILAGPAGEVVYAEKIEGGVVVSIDGERFDAVGPVAISREGGRIAHLARRGDRQFVVVDGRCGLGFDAIWPDDGEAADYLEDEPSFSRDGSSLAYPARLGDEECIVRDDEPSEPFTFISGRPRFGGPRDALIYGAVGGPSEEYLTVGEERIGPFERIWPAANDREISPRWTPQLDLSGGSVVFGARRGRELTWQRLPLG